MTLPANLDQLSAEELRELVRRQAEVITRNDRELNWRQVKIDKLTHEVAYYKRHYFGVKAERLPVEQGQLFEETLAADMAAMTEELAQLSETETKPKGQAKRKPLPPELPRTEIHHEPESTTCACGCQLQRIGEDVAEKLDYTPGTFTVERHIRGKWACAECETLVQAPVPAHVIDKGIPTTGLLAHVLIAKYLDHRVLRTRPPPFGWKRCFTKDEGRPLGVGLQEQASNHHKLRQLRVVVVSVAGKGGARLRQVRFKETNASELLMTCRKVYKRCQNREGVVGPGQGWGIPDYCPTDIRHEGGVTLIQALVRNVGTCRSDVKGEAQADSLRKSQSTDAGHRDGVARSRVEGSVMELDRRGDVVQPCCAGNPRGEDQRG